LTGSATYSATTDYLTDVGAYRNTVSPCGAFDMGGDVWQWNEADINGDGTTRGIRGGAFDNDAVRLASTYDTDIGYAADESNDTGFRVASVGTAPQPGSMVLWASAVSGNWSDATKWAGGAAPNAVGAGAAFSASTTAALTVTLDEPVTLGRLLLGSGDATAGYTLSGSGSDTLTFSNSGAIASAQVSVSDGTHFLDAPVVLASNLVVTSTGSNPWTLSFGTAGITDGGESLSLTMSAGNGTLILSGTNRYTGGTIVDAGTLIVTGRDALAAGTNLTVGADAASVFAALQAGPSVAVSRIAAAVPEPSASVLLVVGVIALTAYGWRRRRQAENVLGQPAGRYRSARSSLPGPAVAPSPPSTTAGDAATAAPLSLVSSQRPLPRSRQRQATA
jgi:autotransporter-associated beta strand protein